MSILGWLVVGFVAGALARWITGADKRGCLATIVVGVVGAFIGGALYRLALGDDVQVFDEFDLGSIFVAFLGSVVLLLVLQALGPRGRR
ncbi:MAG: GlsB/YeaQ/YmgE family stress response membrane protein [Acidimicrobiales bacterium]|nr:GlsB/YeaQ/YmgE family stress response membrane protein [Acidimicrobiales bacterium]